MANKHEDNDFLIEFFFVLAFFWSFFHLWCIKKMTGAKKVVNKKNQFFHARQPREGIFDIWSHLFVLSAFLSRASNCSGSNLGSHWCLKMKSRGLYHTYRLWKSRLLLDLQHTFLPKYYFFNVFIVMFDHLPLVFFFKKLRQQKFVIDFNTESAELCAKF